MLLRRYVLRTFLNTYLLTALALIAVFMIGDFFERADEFISKGAPFSLLLAYYFYKIPFVIFFVAPHGVMLATVISLASMAKNNEITAMKACGVSVTGITLPIVGASIIISMLIVACNEYIAPITNKKMNHIFRVQVQKRSPLGKVEKENIWYKSQDGSIWNIREFDPEKHILKGVSIFVIRGGRFIEKRIDSRLVVWKGGRWNFEDGFVRTFSPNGLENTEFFRERIFPVSETPGDFTITQIRPEEFNLKEMYQEIQDRAAEGKDVSVQWVNFNYKISYPFISVVLALIAIPLSIRSSRHGGVMFSVAINFGMGAACTFIFAMAVSLGRGGTFGPLIAAWGPIILFTSIGFYLILTLDSEKPLPFLK